MKMRKEALVVASIGIFILEIMMLNTKSIEIADYEDLEKLEINTKIKLEGRIIEEKIIAIDFRIMGFENGIEVVCDCDESFKGKEVRVIGLVEKFEEKKQVRALRVEVLG